MNKPFGLFRVRPASIRSKAGSGMKTKSLLNRLAVQNSLATYLGKTRGDATDLAKALGVSLSIVSMWMSGKRVIPVERCLEIERWSKGKVRASSMRPDINWRRVAR